MTTPSPRRCAFALIEALFILAVATMLAAFALTSLTRARRLAQESGSLANLRRIGAMTGHYLADFNGLLPTLSWNKTNHPQYFDDIEASAGQLADIIRRRSPLAAFPRPSVFAYVLYSPIVLADHAGLALPDPLFASPADALRLGWQRTLTGPNADPNFRRFVFSSSYECSAAAYYAGQSSSGAEVYNSTSQNVFGSYSGTSGSPSVLGPRLSSTVRFPSQKAHFYETVSRYSGTRPVFFGFPEARVPMLMMDGSATVRRSGDASRGAYTAVNGTASDATMDYIPIAAFGDPPAPEGQVAQIDGRLRWTYRLLQGRDFGPAIP